MSTVLQKQAVNHIFFAKRPIGKRQNSYSLKTQSIVHHIYATIIITNNCSVSCSNILGSKLLLPLLVIVYTIFLFISPESVSYHHFYVMENIDFYFHRRVCNDIDLKHLIGTQHFC